MLFLKPFSCIIYRQPQNCISFRALGVIIMFVVMDRRGSALGTVVRLHVHHRSNTFTPLDWVSHLCFYLFRVVFAKYDMHRNTTANWSAKTAEQPFSETKESWRKEKDGLVINSPLPHQLLLSCLTPLLPLINELSSSRIHLCNTHRFISCLYAALL